ncbi:IS66 family insertion sequence element accessory protein TnpB [Rhizobium sp. LjRoot258]|uniref:IS66 family insertion sequence element accessory protein TnpB n=1 Tax=Rhizobium sp. LjRoot258 TaxID=3342299 RepID=UPI003F4F6004
MIGPSGNVRVYLACGVTDMRHGIDGLSTLAETVIKEAPGSGAIFGFRGKRGRLPKFYIRFSFFDDRLSLAPDVREQGAGLAFQSRQELDMHLHA